MNDDELRTLAKLCEELNIKRYRKGDFEIEMGPRLISRTLSQGSTKETLSEKRLEDELLGSPIFHGLSDDQLLGLEEIPKDHPAYKLRGGI